MLITAAILRDIAANLHIVIPTLNAAAVKVNTDKDQDECSLIYICKKKVQF
jgi:hypothetical protein